MTDRPRTVARLALPLAVAAFLAPALRSQAPVPQRGRSSINPRDRLLASFRFRSIGPASMGGRIDDIAVSESDPSIIYVGYAVGGVFKSDNNGTTFQPVFETYGTASIGDIAIHPTNPDIVYVGTGEPNNRQTSSFGDGIYKTTDGGKTFTNIGLKDTQTIARIVIDPKNPETVYVASPGHLFGPNPERGIFKTTDGGKTWNKVKFIDDDTGLHRHRDRSVEQQHPLRGELPAAPERLLLQRRRPGQRALEDHRRRQDLDEADRQRPAARHLRPHRARRLALESERRLRADRSRRRRSADDTGASRSEPASTEATPPGAAAVTPPGGNPPATQQAGGRGAPAQQPQAGQPGGEAGASGRPGAGRGNYDWCNNGGPDKGFAGAAAAGSAARRRIRRLRRSTSRAAASSARRTRAPAGCTSATATSRPMYFSQLRVDPSNDKTIYVAGLPVAKSLDGGKTFATLDEAGGHGEPGHVDQHAIWIDPKNPKHLMIGNDGGLDISWDQGKTWDFVNTMATALAYWVSADMRRPYYVYIGPAGQRQLGRAERDAQHATGS